MENLNGGTEKASVAELESEVGGWCGTGPDYTELSGQGKDVTFIQRTVGNF